MANEFMPAIGGVVSPDQEVEHGSVVRNAFALLRTLGRMQRPVGVSRLAAEVGIPKTTAHRLLEQMAREDVVVRRDHKWVIGAGLRDLDQRPPDLAGIAFPHMQAMTRATGATLFLYAGSGSGLSALSRSYGPHVGRVMTASEQVRAGKHPASAIWQALERGQAAAEYEEAHPECCCIATPFSLPSGEPAVLALAQPKNVGVEPFKRPLDRVASLILDDMDRLAS
jgi:hypothetical protein